MRRTAPHAPQSGTTTFGPPRNAPLRVLLLAAACAAVVACSGEQPRPASPENTGLVVLAPELWAQNGTAPAPAPFAGATPAPKPAEETKPAEEARPAQLKPAAPTFVFSPPLAPVSAPAQPFEGIPADAKLPPDADLTAWMGQSVEKTLKGSKAVFVNDLSYEKQVLGAKQPVMVLYYSANTASQGLAALARTLQENFPQLKLCAYKLRTDKDSAKATYTLFGEKRSLAEQPSIVFHKLDGRVVDFKHHTEKGLETLEELKGLIALHLRVVPRDVLDQPEK